MFIFSEVRISNSSFSDNVINEQAILITYSRLFFDNVLIQNNSYYKTYKGNDLLFFNAAFIKINKSPTQISNSQVVDNNLIFLSAIDSDVVF